MKRITSFLEKLTYRLWPGLTQKPTAEQRQTVIIMTFFYFLAPFFVASTVWLILISDWALFGEAPLLLAFLFLVIFILSQRPYTIVVTLREETRLPVTSSLANIVEWSAVLIFGPTVLWLLWISGLVQSVYEAWQLSRRQDNNWLAEPLSRAVQTSGASLIAYLAAAAVYTTVGGEFPLAGAMPSDWLPALGGTLTLAFLPLVIYLPVLAVFNYQSGIPNEAGTLLQLGASITLMPLLTLLFAIPLALAYSHGGVAQFIFLSLGIALANLLAYYLSQSNLRNQARSRELTQLEALGETLLTSAADASNLEEILSEHIGRIFPTDRVEIRLFESDAVWSHFTCTFPTSESVAPPAAWERLRGTDKPYLIEPNVTLPGDKKPFGHVLLAKILVDETEGDARQTAGGVYVHRQESIRSQEEQLLAVQELAAQIGSTLYRAKVHAETAAHQKIAQELEFAGRIQSSFLPSAIPRVDNWDIVATLIPARQTSGDFYDFVPLADGRIGLLVADVADKGTGAALYMALSRTLIRTYAMQYPEEPARALQMANERILTDTESDQFVTVFYGVLEPTAARLTYANAGHNPAYILGQQTQALGKTGIPLGIFDDMTWQQQTVQLEQEDILVLYSDGIPEAQNDRQEAFGESRLLAAVQTANGCSAQEIQHAITGAVQTFVADAPQFDDITLVVARRIK